MVGEEKNVSEHATVNGSAEAKVFRVMSTILLTIEVEDWVDDGNVNDREIGLKSPHSPPA